MLGKLDVLIKKVFECNMFPLRVSCPVDVLIKSLMDLKDLERAQLVK